MALTPSNMLPLDTVAPDFDLVDAVSGERFTAASFAEAPLLCVMFICNHCPFVIHVQDELGRVVADYPDVAFVAINSNDVQNYPQDSPENMKALVEAAALFGERDAFVFEDERVSFAGYHRQVASMADSSRRSTIQLLQPIASARAGSSLMSSSATEQPSSARRLPAAYPRSPSPPVMIATLPFKPLMDSSFYQAANRRDY